MNKIDLKRLAGYEDDFALWSAEQAALIRAGKFDRVDLENVAEEIESLGKRDKREIRSRVRLIVMHLLKWEKQLEHRSRSWGFTIRDQRDEVLRLLEESPSLGGYPGEVLPEVYPWAREKASDETTVYLKYFPETCPYTIEQVLDPDYLPGAL